ncbi:hypothetical protein [Holospora curviuscula]|uniref:hypothetical protein n=1 Tax=Holospora curviuscula TaxID=1082868 RepID=UPI001A9C3D22|nr:hypothetical protein [Holospora curviuscula]
MLKKLMKRDKILFEVLIVSKMYKKYLFTCFIASFFGLSDANAADEKTKPKKIQ